MGQTGCVSVQEHPVVGSGWGLFALPLFFLLLCIWKAACLARDTSKEPRPHGTLPRIRLGHSSESQERLPWGVSSPKECVTHGMWPCLPVIANLGSWEARATPGGPFLRPQVNPAGGSIQTCRVMCPEGCQRCHREQPECPGTLLLGLVLVPPSAAGARSSA